MNTADSKATNFFRVIIFIVGIGCISTSLVSAEPWLSNRFAQNCAGCHAAGRLNKPPKGRRCTLSCQGCHVSPQGGGLRNTYGKWNSQRWLRSFQGKVFHGEKTPAPLIKQPYAKRVTALGKGKKLPPKSIGTPGHAVINNTQPPLKYYDKHSWNEWKYNLASESQFLATVPKADPYLQERTLSTYAGADFRYFFGDYKLSGLTKRDVKLDGFMAVDVGLRMRPVRWHKLSFVVESRIQDSANDYALSSLDSSSGYLKSAYMLVDDLIYNSYVQFGNLRPLFGNSNVSHISLSQDISGFNGRPTFRTLSMGTAPNIPFLMVNYIMKSNAHGTSGDRNLGSNDDGVVVSFGGRWVTLGLSTKFSFWSTSRDGTGSLAGQKRKWDMYSLTAGSKVGPAIINFESVRVEREKTTVSGSDAGNVNTIEAKIQVWKELYLTSSYAMSNTTSYLTKGETNEISYGLKFFPVAGFEFEIIASTREEKFKDTNNIFGQEGNLKIDLAALQLHAFF